MIDYAKNAIFSIWSNKVRSVLTVLGIVIGVTSVCSLISIGQGLKKDVSSMIEGFGTNVITIVSGKLDTTGSSQVNPAQFLATDILTPADVESLKKLDKVEQVAPMSLVTQGLTYNNQPVAATIAGSTPNFSQTIDMLSVGEGRSITAADAGKNVIILAGKTKENLFGSDNPIGKKVLVGKDEFEIIGIFNKPKSASIASSEFDTIDGIPFDTATKLNKNQVKISRIFIKANDKADIKQVKADITTQMKLNHGGVEDFTAMTQDDLLGLLSTFVNMSTAMVSAIAAISLIVGGIGIMNIMLVTVTERTKEIGLRKAVGATRKAILSQFLVESIIITLLGGLIGLGFTLIATTIVAAKTELKPDVTIGVVALAIGISMLIGVVFGLWPAFRAAKKDPIEALRYE